MTGAALFCLENGIEPKSIVSAIVLGFEFSPADALPNDTCAEVTAYVKENGFDKKVDTATIEAIMDKVLAENTQALEDFRNGKVKAKQALFGACMRELKGIGDPAVIREMLDKKLG